MIHKLHGWVWTGGAVLAFIAGCVNAVGFMGFQHQAVTHLTGTTTQLGIAVAQLGSLPPGAPPAGHLLGVIVAFFAGSVGSGVIIQDSTLRFGRRYGVVLVLESLCLLAAVVLLRDGHYLGQCFASAACGLQNAMASTYSGAVLRTTHVSGLFTDLGIAVGHALRRVPFDSKRVRLIVLLILSFFCGAVVGTRLFDWLQYDALLLPVVLTGGAGMGYGVWRQVKRALPPEPKEHHPHDPHP